MIDLDCKLTKRTLLIAWAVAIAVSIVPLSGQVASPLYSKEKTDLQVTTVDGASAEFRVVTVTERDDQNRGLMHVRFMPLDQGMVFKHSQDRRISMWMKNTRISLDMWFVTDEGVVTKVVTNTEPMSEKPISSGGLVRAVVEVNAGLSSLIGVTPGATVAFGAMAED